MHSQKIPLGVKWLYSAFMAVLVPVYWQAYGPSNFLYFCDVALFMTLVAVWSEKPLWAAMPAVGIVVPQLVWCLDFIAMFFGVELVGMTTYMLDSNITVFARSLSFFHFWLPFLLIFLVHRLGYDRRALLYWTVLAWALVLFCYFFTPPPPAPPGSSAPVNINYVFGLGESAKQRWMPELAWVGLLLVALPTLFYLPAHFALKALFPPKSA